MADAEFAPLWKAFRGQGSDRVIVGVAAAFALVAAANGTLEACETERFLDVVRGSRLAPTDPATEPKLARAFDDLVRALLTHPESGRLECLRVLSDFGFDPMRSEIIWSAARAALVADAALDAAERSAADEIRLALRIRPTPH
jgi:tellurite resistance protein